VKKIRRNIMIVVVILLVVLFFSLKNEFLDVINVLQNVNITWLLVAIICLFFYFLFGALVLQKMIHALGNYQYSFFKALRMNLLGLFFNGITPSSSGGQPFQIYLMSQEGIDPRKGSCISIQYTILFQIALLIVAFLSIIFNYLFEFFPDIPFVKQLLVIGLIIHSAVVVILLGVSFFPIINRSVIRFVVFLLSKLHLIKDRKKTTKRITEYLNEFYASAKELFKNRKLVIVGIIYQVVSLLFFYSIPLFLMYSIGHTDTMWLLPVIIGTSYVNVIGAFIPSPGGAGGFEFAFLKFFGYYFTGPILTTVMLLWRFVTYYLVLLVGGCVLIFYKNGNKEVLPEILEDDKNRG